ncbi:MAG TPA: hypothetical protein VMY39_07955 [Planctomycetota bacterium]|nr:hypothetical protein [Planctomycetota bacterium]
MSRAIAAVCVLTVLCATGTVDAQDGPHLRHLWARWQANLSVDEQVTRTEAFMDRIAKAGYTGIVLVDNKFKRWNELSEADIAKRRRVREYARRLKLDFVVAVTATGYANDLMSNDPNLAAGMPVVDAPFVVRHGRLVPDDPTTLANGTFEKHRDNKPDGWDVDAPGKVSFIDTDVRYEEKPSLRMQDPADNPPNSHARASQILNVKPWRYYRITVALKTEGLTSPGDVRLMGLGLTGEHAGQWLNVPYLYAKPTQDWTRLGYTINTRDYEKIAIYIGSWSGGRGKMWWADVTMEPAGLVNLLRREGTPFKATSADGKTVYVEGKDLPEMRDPGLGNSPYKGGYQWHAQPEIVIPAGSRLREGDRVLLSYCHTMIMCYWDQVPICLAARDTNKWIDWCIANCARHLQPDGYFMQHDEIRMQGWDASCERSGRTPGQNLARNIRFCRDTIRKHSPGAVMYVWSDMFDLYHNAPKTGTMALVRGDGAWYESWKGLTPDVGLMNWNGRKRESIEFFSKLGQKQIISAASAGDLAAKLANAKGLAGVEGAMYVTWGGDYSQIEAFADKAREILKK